MSKLDDILDTVETSFGSVLLGNRRHYTRGAAKRQIKHLMLEIIETSDYGGVRHSTPPGSVDKWDETRLVSSLRQKV